MNNNLDPISELYETEKPLGELKRLASDLKCWDLTKRQICDIELLLNGSFSPLIGFMRQTDYCKVLEEMRLESGALWPMPITLDVTKKFSLKLAIGEEIALKDQEGTILAIMTITDKWTPNKVIEAKKVYGTTDINHPGVNYLLNEAEHIYVGGPIVGLESPTHYDFCDNRHSPNKLKENFKKLGWTKIVAFRPKNIIHRAHQEMTLRVTKEVGANLLIHSITGMTNSGDIKHYTKIKCYKAVLTNYQPSTTQLSLLNLATRMAGPREVIWHGLIHKNYGCTHLIIEKDSVEESLDSKNKPLYNSHEAQNLFRYYEEEMGIKIINAQEMIYVEETSRYQPVEEAMNNGLTTKTISKPELEHHLDTGLNIPEWFSFPSVLTEIRRTRPLLSSQGFTIFFTGLSGSGKSTIANVLMSKLMEIGSRSVTLLDGDIVRKNLSSELGFSKHHRDLNIRRIGYVASEITKNGGVAICAPIAPYSKTRQLVRQDVENWGTFIEIYVATSLEECERRDRKGLYQKAREGKIKEFTGISDPYEVPQKPEIRLETENVNVQDCVEKIIYKLVNLGLIKNEQP
jgi:sulfate adenylyltransferase